MHGNGSRDTESDEIHIAVACAMGKGRRSLFSRGESGDGSNKEARYKDLKLKGTVSPSFVAKLLLMLQEGRLPHPHVVAQLVSLSRALLFPLPNVVCVETGRGSAHPHSEANNSPYVSSTSKMPLGALRGLNISGNLRNRLSFNATQGQPTVIVAGDIHGSFRDLVSILTFLNQEPDANHQIIFNGDFVDRGEHSTEVVIALMALKLCYPKFIHLIRGNHENAALNKHYGFSKEFKSKYSSSLLKSLINDVFYHLPLGAVLDKKVFICHGGISEHPSFPGRVITITELCAVNRSVEAADKGVLADCLWSDPHPRVVRESERSSMFEESMNHGRDTDEGSECSHMPPRDSEELESDLRDAGTGLANPNAEEEEYEEGEGEGEREEEMAVRKTGVPLVSAFEDLPNVEAIKFVALGPDTDTDTPMPTPRPDPVKFTHIRTSRACSLDVPENASAREPVNLEIGRSLQGFQTNTGRGAGVYFGQAALEAFLESEGLSLLVRSHQGPDIRTDMRKGYALDMQGKCVTVFSASGYCGLSNRGAVLSFSGAVGEGGLPAYKTVNYQLVEPFRVSDKAWWAKGL